MLFCFVIADEDASEERCIIDRVLHSAARLLGVSLNMLLSRVICMTHYTGFPFGSASFTELLGWDGTVLSALPQFTCRNSVALCRPWLVASSASFLLWCQTLSSPCKHLDYAASCILSCCSFYLEFTSLADSVVTKELRYTPLLYTLLKTALFHRGWTAWKRL